MNRKLLPKQRGVTQSDKHASVGAKNIARAAQNSAQKCKKGTNERVVTAAGACTSELIDVGVCIITSGRARSISEIDFASTRGACVRSGVEIQLST